MAYTFQVIAHRGDSAHAPDNTAVSFQGAIDAGAALIETDVRVTADGILILEHDEDVGGLLVADATLAELRAFNPKLLTVATTLKEFGQSIPFCWEVKAPRIVPALVTLVRDLVPDSVWERTEFTSFVWANVVAVAAFSPGSSIGWLTTDWDEAAIERVARARLPQICPPATKVLARPALVQTAHAQGLKVRVWGVSELSLVTRLAAIEVNGGTVNFPREALDALAGHSG